MADLLLPVVTVITDLAGPAAGPLAGGAPVVILVALIIAASAALPWAARADRAAASRTTDRATTCTTHDEEI